MNELERYNVSSVSMYSEKMLQNIFIFFSRDVDKLVSIWVSVFILVGRIRKKAISLIRRRKSTTYLVYH